MNDHDIRSIVSALGLTTQQVAEMCGVNVRTVFRWMAGTSRVPPLVVDRLRAELAKQRERGNIGT